MKKTNRVILDATHFDLTIKRLAHQLIENHNDFSNTVILGFNLEEFSLPIELNRNYLP